MNYNLLETEIRNWISSVAGVVDFCALDSKNQIDFKNNGIIVQKSIKAKNAIDLTLGLIILVNLNARIIVEEIYQIVSYKLQEKNLKISKLNVYIKGIK
ncbi:hypothetical protein [Metamycoplasma auris]|uniref:Asp23/Gls24 family envelope stress response protein n=1 Tax=Metamycoplasma auris TaxID=51363 RepID=A0A2W7G613_9BACT|nr:hypothetical protein [Metamycoplasma auris]PZW00551.1 hypothetical protein BCF89_10310 [Metamycoplasma auris]